MIAKPAQPIGVGGLARAWYLTFQTSRARRAGCLPPAGEPVELPERCRTAIHGKRVLVTGSSKTIGQEIALQLVHAGASVITCARSRPTAAELAALPHVKLDLGDKASIPAAVDAVQALGALDVLVLNAAVANAQSYEVNVLGNARFLTQLMRRQLVVPGKTRVVVVTGDIYATESDCDMDFKGLEARMYAQSKLGLNWWCMDLLRAHPDLELCLIHPGVIDSELFVLGGLLGWLKRALFLTNPMGAYPVALVSSVPQSEFVRGGYLINTLGWVTLPPKDPLNNAERMSKFVAKVNAML